MLQFIVGQDGSKIGQEAEKFSLLPNEKKYSKRLKSDIFDFVGFVIDKEKLLAVFLRKRILMKILSYYLK